MYKIRTVDVWDTLIRRKCHPECVKLATASYLYLLNFSNLKPEYREIKSIYLERLNIEKTIADSLKALQKDDEYTIDNVVSQLVSTISVQPNETVAQAAVEYEFNFEIKNSFKDPEIETFLSQFAAEKTIFLSDFYMTAERLRKLLEHHDLLHLIDHGISSCDVGLNKRSGNLFKYVLEQYQHDPKSHIHIGDNAWSDYESPRSLGISAQLYLPSELHTQRLEREALFASTGNLFQYIDSKAIGIIGSYAKDLDARALEMLTLGIKSAPLLVGFSLFIAEKSISAQTGHIYFLTREGEFFHKIYQTLLATNHYHGHLLPENSIIEVSRLSTFRASIKECSKEELQQLWSLFKTQSLSGLFLTLGLDISKFSHLLTQLGLSETTTFESPDSNETLNKLISNPEFISAVDSIINQQKGLLKNYLSARGIDDTAKIGIVDIGWRGTIQDNLARIYPDKEFQGLYLVLREFVNKQLANCKKVSYCFDDNKESSDNHLETFALLESLFSSNAGSTTGYENIDGKVSAIKMKTEAEEGFYKNHVSLFQLGIELMAKEWAPYLEYYSLTSRDFFEISSKVINALNTINNDDLARSFMTTPQNDLFAYGEYFEKDSPPSIATILLSPLFKSRRTDVINYVRRTQWITGVKNIETISALHKYLLVAVFKVAHKIRKRRLKPKKSNSGNY